MRGFLFGVAPLDAATFAAVVLHRRQVGLTFCSASLVVCSGLQQVGTPGAQLDDLENYWRATFTLCATQLGCFSSLGSE